MLKDKIMFRDVFLILKRNFIGVFAIVLVLTGFSISLTVFMKKQYRSTFEINVYSKYFQNPLISGIIPGVYSVPEMRFAIDSMVKEAISDKFIDMIGTEYKIYSNTQDKVYQAKERQYLRERFSYYSTGGQGYKISFSDSDPLRAKIIADRTLEVVKGYFIQSRINTIEMVKRVMVNKLTSFNATQNVNKNGGDKALVSKSPDVLRAELMKIESNLSALKKQYKDNHPRILKLNQKRDTILSWLEEYGDLKSSSDIVDASLTMSTSKLISEQISSKFYTKYHDFNIALDIEKQSLEGYIGVIVNPQIPTAPISPKKRMFASVGFLLGLMFAFLYVFYKEILVPNTAELIAIEAKKFGALYLGSLEQNNSEDKLSIIKKINIDSININE